MSMCRLATPPNPVMVPYSPLERIRQAIEPTENAAAESKWVSSLRDERDKFKQQLTDTKAERNKFKATTEQLRERCAISDLSYVETLAIIAELESRLND